MKKSIPFIIILLLSINASAQLISRFTWENNPTTAISGSNAISVSSYATVSTGGKNSSKGLNPGNGSNDINLVLDGTAFNVPALDVAIDFRREESQASFFSRGSYFNFGMNSGSLAANFQLINGASYTTINSGNVFSIPDDHVFHNYHFNYDNNTGIAKIWVDAVLVYTYTGIAGTSLYWTGAGNVTIGKDMDATGRNVAVLDNLIIQKQANALLPLKLLSFSAEATNDYASVNWNTTEEVNVTSFIVERSSNGGVFSAIKNTGAVNGYNATNHYHFTDSMPFTPVCYYRLKMVNDDGSFTYSAIKSVTITNIVKSEITAFPNPTVDYVTIKLNNAKAGQYHYTVSTITGLVIMAADMQLNNGANQVKIDLTKTTVKGVMVIHMGSTQTNTSETFTIIKK
ncbi:MAG: T9SS type A sorting domain-containing protein [Bacteroidota bacterium]